jgi:hypothetical protein
MISGLGDTREISKKFLTGFFTLAVLCAAARADALFNASDLAETHELL